LNSVTRNFSYSEIENRVLVVPPTVKDGHVTQELLSKSGLNSHCCRNLSEVCTELSAGAGALLLTEEAVTSHDIQALLDVLQHQPPWSDLPIILLMRGGAQSPAATRVLRALRNITLIERPAPMRSVISAAQSAIRGRQRQYQIREQIDTIQQEESHSRELQKQLEIAIDASELGTFHCDMPMGHIVWNNRCKAHFWLPPEAEVDFDLFYSLLHPDDRERTREAVLDCVWNGKLYDIEYRTVSPDNQIRWVRATGRTYYDAEHRPVCFDGTTQDITEQRRQAEERRQLLEAERAARQEAERVSRMKDEFLANLSHELRTPLNVIFGWTQLLKLSTTEPETVLEGITIIDRNVRLQTKLIEDLLDMNRIISGKIRLDVQAVQIAEIVEATIEGLRPAADAKGIRLEKVIDCGAGAVSGDPGRLQQVLWNLLTNAIKFTPKGGRIHVLAERAESYWEISIADTGDGISPEFLPHLFERFSQADASMTRKHGGLGLGLSIVKSLVELHGGTVTARSAGKGLGSTFLIRLPIRVIQGPADDTLPAAFTATRDTVRTSLSNLRGVSVLVIDDEADARELMRRCLLESEAETKLAASAEEAQQLLKSFQPDVIVSDIGMPDQDGYEFMRNVRRSGLKTPAVALTAFARPEDRLRAIQAGFQTHLPKPVEPSELLSVIAGLAGRFEE
jgi:signal transduction histidine kinase